MGLNEARNAMQFRVLSELAAIWRKLADDPAAPKDLRAQAQEMVEEFDHVVELRDPDATEHFESEELLVRMARHLPMVAEVHTTPEDPRGVLRGEE